MPRGYSLKQIREIMNFWPDAMLLVDRNARVLLANSQAERMFEYLPTELRGMDLSNLIPERYRSAHENHFAGYLAHPTCRRMGLNRNLVALRRDGSDFPVAVSFEPTQITGEQHVICFIRDISEYKQVEHALRASEQTYRALFEYANDAIFLISLEGVHVQVNQKAADLLGYTQEELVGMEIKNIVAPFDYPDSQNRLKLLLSGTNMPSYERFFRKKDGTIFPVEINVSLVRDLEGNPRYLQSIVRDISEHKKTEQSLQRMASQRQRLLELSLKMVSSWHLDQDIPEILSSLGELLALDLGMIAWADEANNKLLPAFIFGEDRIVRFIKEHNFPIGQGGVMNMVYQTGKALLINNAQDDPRVVHPDSLRSAHEHVIVMPLKIDGKTGGILTIIRTHDKPFLQDEFELLQFFSTMTGVVVQNARLYSEVQTHLSQIQQQQNDLHALAARLELVREEERRQLAIELHDRVGQSLTGLKLNLQIIQRQIPAEVQQGVSQRIHDSVQLLEETTTLVRNVMTDLRPPMLDDYGLRSALLFYTRDYAQRTGIKVKVIGEELQPRLPEQVEIVLYRIFQEGLNNTAKYARASQVEIHLESSPQNACLRLVDNGDGFDMAEVFAPERKPHWGLLGMQERAASIGGRLTIHAAPGQGTCIEIEVPREGACT